jgi:hypothetical protein
MKASQIEALLMLQERIKQMIELHKDDDNPAVQRPLELLRHAEGVNASLLTYQYDGYGDLMVFARLLGWPHGQVESDLLEADMRVTGCYRRYQDLSDGEQGAFTEAEEQAAVIFIRAKGMEVAGYDD